MSPIGENIKKIRVSEKLTQSELAKRLFVTRQTVSNWENGKSIPSIVYIHKIAKILNVEALQLIGNDKLYQAYAMKKYVDTTRLMPNSTNKNFYRKTENIIKVSLVLLIVYLLFEIIAIPVMRNSENLFVYTAHFHLLQNVRPFGFTILGILGMTIFERIYKDIPSYKSARIICGSMFVGLTALHLYCQATFFMPIVGEHNWWYFHDYNLSELGLPFVLLGGLFYYAFLKCNRDKVEITEEKIVFVKA